MGLIPPTHTIIKTGQEMVVDGVRTVFQMAQGSEAPSEMMFCFPDKKALCVSEVLTKHMHNVYTIRGAKMRDALAWSKYANEAIDLFPEAEVAFASHHWPTWGAARIQKYMADQRDTYRFLHDEALNLANKGQTMEEIGDAPFFPKGLAADSSSRQPRQRRRPCAASRRPGTTGLPGRGRHLAQRLSGGRQRAARRGAQTQRQHTRPGHGARHDAGAAV